MIDKGYKPSDVEDLTLEEFHALLDHETERRKQQSKQARSGKGQKPVSADAALEGWKARNDAIGKQP